MLKHKVTSDRGIIPPSTAIAGDEILFIFTTFPCSTETFLQREVRELKAAGIRIRLVSLWGGSTQFEGIHISRFHLISLFKLLWCLPLVLVSRRCMLGVLIKTIVIRQRSIENLLENILGAAYAICEAASLKSSRVVHVHAVWASAPAAAAYVLSKITMLPYSVGAHAYDIYEHGGDAFLIYKMRSASFVRTSTMMAAKTLYSYGTNNVPIHIIRRGLNSLPEYKILRSDRSELRLLCVSRLVPKKGLIKQLLLLRFLNVAGFNFRARIVGAGPLQGELEHFIQTHGLCDRVELLGYRSFTEILEFYSWADVLIHTGIVSETGDRDGLPNVIPEAMASGCVVFSTDQPGALEAVKDEVTGFVAPIDDLDTWYTKLQKIVHDHALVEQIRFNAREWVEKHFSAEKNIGELIVLFEKSLGRNLYRSTNQKM